MVHVLLAASFYNLGDVGCCKEKHLELHQIRNVNQKSCGTASTSLRSEVAKCLSGSPSGVFIALEIQGKEKPKATDLRFFRRKEGPSWLL